MKRSEMVHRLQQQKMPWDFIIIGGGATGLWTAVDAASRGFSTLLLEREDFASETSSRSTKLIHGGVRYLQQGNIALVKEALKERGLLWKNAPHLISHLPFFVPSYHHFASLYFGIGLKFYDLLAGPLGIDKSKHVWKREAKELFPTLRQAGLKGGTLYTDGQFDDARLAITLAKTAADHGALLVNYIQVTDLIKRNNKVIGIKYFDHESQEEGEVEAKVIINATGPFTDTIRKKDHPFLKKVIAPSRGTHLVVGKKFLPGDCGVVYPHTEDGRVLFLIPWQNHTLIGTTDVATNEPLYHPSPSPKEIHFILKQANRHLENPIQKSDILSAFTGIRPLVRVAKKGLSTKSLSREHHIEISKSGMLHTYGGKWTTGRKMAEDVIDQAINVHSLEKRPSVTEKLRLHGFTLTPHPDPRLAIYGDDQKILTDIFQEKEDYRELIDPALPYYRGEIIFSIRHEMAQNVTDILARRCRSLFLSYDKAIAMAPIVAKIMAEELGHDRSWQESQIALFSNYATKFNASYTISALKN